LGQRCDPFNCVSKLKPFSRNMTIKTVTVSTCELDSDGEEQLHLTLPKTRSVHFSPEVVSPISSPSFRCALQGFQSPSDRFFDPRTPTADKKGLNFFERSAMTTDTLETPETEPCTQGQSVLQVPPSLQIQTESQAQSPPQMPSSPQIPSSAQVPFPPQSQTTQVGCPQSQAELVQRYLSSYTQNLLAQHSLVAQSALAAQQSLAVQQAMAAAALTTAQQQLLLQQQQNPMPCVPGSQGPFPSSANANTTQSCYGSHQAHHSECAPKMPQPMPAKVFVDLSQLRELAEH